MITSAVLELVDVNKLVSCIALRCANELERMGDILSFAMLQTFRLRSHLNIFKLQLSTNA